MKTRDGELMTSIAPDGRVRITMRMPCGCCAVDKYLDFRDASNLAMHIIADVALALEASNHAEPWRLSDEEGRA